MALEPCDRLRGRLAGADDGGEGAGRQSVDGVLFHVGSSSVDGGSAPHLERCGMGPPAGGGHDLLYDSGRVR